MLRQPVLLVLFAVLLASTTLEAQQRGGPRGRSPFGRRDGYSFLLAVGAVREELKINDAQEQLLTSLISDLRNQRFALIQDQSGGQDATAEDFAQSMQAISRQGNELVAVVLEPKQAERLRQIHLQYEGVSALNRDEFIKSLGVSEEQLQQIRQIPGLGQGRLPRLVSPEQEAEILGVLSGEQQETWNKMKGKVYLFPEWLARNDFEWRGGRRRGNRGGQRPERPAPDR